MSCRWYYLIVALNCCIVIVRRSMSIRRPSDHRRCQSSCRRLSSIVADLSLSSCWCRRFCRNRLSVVEVSLVLLKVVLLLSTFRHSTGADRWSSKVIVEAADYLLVAWIKIAIVLLSSTCRHATCARRSSSFTVHRSSRSTCR